MFTLRSRNPSGFGVDRNRAAASAAWVSAMATAVLAAAPAWAQDQAASVEKCSKELGTLAVAEPQQHTMAGLGRYGLGSPSTMLRMLVQESGCFAVVERGVAMQNMQQERALANSGQLQGDANIGGGQMQGADFVMTPAVQFSGDTGGVGGTVGNWLGRVGPLGAALGGVVGGVKFGEAETTLLVADVRSGIQVASAEGKATRMNFSVGGWGWSGLGWASAGGYTKTPEGKLIAASLLDNYNKIVRTVRDKPFITRNAVQASTDNAARATPATGRAQPVAPTQTAPAVQVVQQPAAVAPVAMPQNVTINVPSRRASQDLPISFLAPFSGTFEGADSGVFAITVESDGMVSGTGQSLQFKSFKLVGKVDQYGTIVFGAQNASGTATFQGLIEPRTGELTGKWKTSDGAMTGTFKGQRGG
jgi:curli biogenesis system outer membrane secretion channel CsgG